MKYNKKLGQCFYEHPLKKDATQSPKLAIARFGALDVRL